MNELALFAGAGGGILGGHLLGWRTVCAVEIEEYPRRVLLARQRDGILPRFPIWDDVKTFNGHEWRGRVDIVTGGFPCQDISCAGKGAGLSGERSGLWSEFARIIGEVRPQFALVENSPMLVIRGLDRVLGDLAEMGYDARWGIIGAHHTGAPHGRNRLFLMGYTASIRQQEMSFRIRENIKNRKSNTRTWQGERVDKPNIIGVVDGVANQLDRLKAIGNGQVPAVVRLAWELLAMLEEGK